MNRVPLRVAMIGHGFMGAAHSQGWRVAPRFFDLPLAPHMSVIVGRDPERTELAREKFGWDAAATEWREVIKRADIDVIDICTPGDSHAEIAIAALEAGKHVFCEKPLANTVDEAEQMAAAAGKAALVGVQAMVGFSYRRVPAIPFARQLIAEGRLGEIRQVRAQYLQDWLIDANGPMTWRLDKALAGSGSLGDIGAHAIDMVQYLTNSTVDTVSGTMHTFVTDRPLLGEARGLSGTASDERGTVTVDDAAWFTARLSNGAYASFEATRFATGRKNALRVEISGSTGAIAFDMESMNELQFYDATQPAGEQGFKRIMVTEPVHPYVDAWWPPGHSLGYEHAFSHQVRDFVLDIHNGTVPSPSFANGLQVQRVLDAVEQSARAGSAWTATQPLGGM